MSETNRTPNKLKYAHIKIGQRFGMLVILDIFKDQFGRRCVHVQCDCGGTTKTLIGLVVNQLTKSCGCHQSHVLSARNHKHGLAKTPTWHAWMGLRRRCNDKSDKFFHAYGGRGIKVCERWSEFSNFLADMGERPSPTHSIDRIDNDGNYEPSNCRWATKDTQKKNRRGTRVVLIDGEEMSFSDARKKLHVRWTKLVEMVDAGELQEITPYGPRTGGRWPSRYSGPQVHASGSSRKI